ATAIAVFASMSAYLLAQLVDIQLYHFWKNLTKGKHLWLRNNFSTFLSQLVDTCSVLLLLCSFGKIEWSLFTDLLIAGVLFKILIALTDTPFLYLFVGIFRKVFNLKPNEELKIL
ncbi:MAG: queuosine precursor transporter, partial [Flavobacteriaceae bacterium]|nr:queuosine precursor transporter [Flavobacteriaceae bacterium]